MENSSNDLFIKAAENGLVNDMVYFLKHGADLYYANDYGSALGVACFYGMNGAIDFLVEKGFDVNFQTDEISTGLMMVLDSSLADSHIVDICARLLRYGADPLLEEKGGQTALSKAIDMQFDECVALFENHALGKVIKNDLDEKTLAF